MRKSMAWAAIIKDERLQKLLPTGQIDDAKEKAKTSRDGAAKAVRLAWSHILFPIKTEATVAGSAFDLDHLSISSKDRAAIPLAVYEKAKNDGIAKEKLGPEALWLHLKPLWPEDKPHLGVAEVADWFGSYVYLPKLRDRVVLDAAIRDAAGKLDPSFGFADRFDEAAGKYVGLVWAKSLPEIIPQAAVIVRSEVAFEHLRPTGCELKPILPAVIGARTGENGGAAEDIGKPTIGPRPPRRFFGSVEIDLDRPVKAFDAILNAVVMELQRTHGTKVKLTLEIEAEAPAGFAEGDIGVVRDNARQLKFKAESTGFEE